MRLRRLHHLAFQMAVMFGRVLDGFGGPFAEITDLVAQPPPASVIEAENAVGFSHQAAVQRRVPGREPASKSWRGSLALAGATSVEVSRNPRARFTCGADRRRCLCWNQIRRRDRHALLEQPRRPWPSSMPWRSRRPASASGIGTVGRCHRAGPAGCWNNSSFRSSWSTRRNWTTGDCARTSSTC